MALSGTVLVYNRGASQVVGRVSMRHAITMLWRNVARVHTPAEGDPVGPYQRPRALELLKRVVRRVVDATRVVPYSKTALWIRDKGRCGYCLEPGNTMDHIFPKSRGGTGNWMNAITACADCNWEKANRTPTEAGMPLRLLPFEPTWAELFDSSDSHALAA